ncbi:MULTISPECIES: hypothetical protein [unclassified Variovorax]|uniref:hypothetical protein n=1 Tax=unclassified Variovorax TaxID=663243 RepID=UPI0013161FC3|nr:MULTISPECIES: hypothetical protein [unclassified Variovorax]VTU43172.1 hypothetical protein SRS16P1_00456 [Variovorax sp. SRS16]VTU43204.1 hypothetical protein E5P1_00453 [Variovorax sp. PBL-E5]VTU43397.1 hypothetical protein H6P1_00450 [Variovorax sp. PBL-H6]
MAKFKDAHLQKLYDGMLAAAADKNSELYHEGQPRRGAGHRAAFWDGFSGKYTLNGATRSANVVPGTFSSACFQAGQAWARKLAAESKPASNRGGAGRNQGRKPGAPDGLRRKARGVRFSDTEWEDAKLVGIDVVRAFVAQRAAELRALPGEVLLHLQASPEPLEAYQVAKALGGRLTPMEAGRVLAGLEQDGLVASDDETGTANDLYRRFRAAPGR